METKCAWIPFYYYIISYNLCTTDCLVDYLYSIILQMGHSKCLPEFSWADHPACVCFVTMNNSPPWFMQPQCCLHLWEDAAVQHTSLCHWEHDWHPFWQVPDTVYTLPFSPAIWPGHWGKKKQLQERERPLQVYRGQNKHNLWQNPLSKLSAWRVFFPDQPWRTIGCGDQQEVAVEIGILIHWNGEVIKRDGSSE